jgi:hypothetical protein
MGKREKLLSVPEKVIDAIKADLTGNGVHFYKVDEIPSVFIDKDLIHPDVVAKSTCMVAALSGSAADDREYMFLSTLREDKGHTDMDPIVMVYNTNTDSPEPSGVLRLHGDFNGRTLPLSSTASLSELQNQTITSGAAFDQVDTRFEEAMHYMAYQYQQHFDGTGEHK